MRHLAEKLAFAVLAWLFLPGCNNYTPSGEEDILIDLETRYQTIEGFGSCVVNYKDFPEEYNDPAFFDRVVQDLGLSIVRVPLMEHTEWINDDDDPDHFNWDGFWLKNNLERKGLEESMLLMQEFKSRGVERFMGTPWSPPEFMKTNRAPIQGGYLRADMLDEYAEYMAAQIILAKKNYGIDLNWVSIQNELLFIEFYRSCVYNPWVLKEAVRSLMHKFEKEGIRTQILMPEDMMFVDRMLSYIEPTMNDPETSEFNGHFCCHRHGGKDQLDRWLEETSAYGRQNWMTETSGHLQTWKGALKMAADIQDYLVCGNFSAWIYWQLSGGGDGRYAILLDGKPTPKYYAAKHFYRYIRPGAVRVKAESKKEDLRVSAFHHPVEGSLTLVVVNEGEQDFELSLNTGFKYDIYRSTEKEECISAGRFHPGDVLIVPARGIITLKGTHRSLKTLRSLPALQASWDIPGDADAGLWGNTAPFPRSYSFQMSADGGNVSMKEQLEEMKISEIKAHRRENKWTLLHAVLLNGDGDAVRYLLDQGVDINAPASDGWTPLHMAAATFVDNAHMKGKEKDYSKYDLLQMLLDAGADLTVTTDDGWTALHTAVANAHTGWRGVEAHSLDRIRILMDRGIDVNARDMSGKTAMHLAALQGYFNYRNNLPEVFPEVVELLLAGGADADIVDNQGHTALDYAREMGYDRIVSSLEGGFTGKEQDVHISDFTPLLGPELLKAAWDGDIERVKRLLSKGSDMGYVDSDGFTALDRARDSGHDEIVKLLEEFD